MATLLSLAGYLLYSVCIATLSILVWIAMSDSSSFNNLPDRIQIWIVFILPFVLKNFQWVVLISKSHYTLPSSVSQVIALLLCLASYLVCIMILPVLLSTCSLVWSAALGQHRDINQLPDWIFIIMLGVTFAVTDRVTSYYMDPALISEFLSGILRFFTHIVMATLLRLAGCLVSIAFMLALSYLVLIIAHGAIQNARSRWPELIHTSIVALTLMMLNMMWGSPFEKLASTDGPNMKSALVGYLIYIVCSMALAYHLFGTLLLLKTFIISITFVTLDMFVKPSSVTDMTARHVGLTGMIGTTLVLLFFMSALSFVVFMFLHTWAEILLPSTRRDYPAGTFVIIVGLTFMVMKTMLGIPVEGPSIFSDMKARLLGITDMINEYHGPYVVIRNLTVLAIPLLSMELRRIVSMYQLYTTTAFIVALGLVLTMPPVPGTPTENPASTLVTDDFVQKTFTSFVTSQIKCMEGGIEQEQVTDS